MNQFVRVVTPLVAFLLLLSAPGAEAARKSKELLQYIPADSPYVLAYTEALPKDLQERFEPAIDNTLLAYRRILEASVEDFVARSAAQGGSEQEAERVRALVGEIASLMSVDALRDAGLGKGSLFAIYGDGLLPVMRLALTDIDAFDTAFARMEEAAGEKFSVGEVKGKAYRYRDFDKLRFIVASLGKDVVLAAVPVSFSDVRLADTLGLKPPRNNMARSKGLAKVAKQYGFTRHFVSLIDTVKLVDGFLNDPGGRNAELLKAFGLDSLAFSDVCKAEIGAMAAVTPRIVSGYTHVGTDFVDTDMIVELRDDIAAGLAALPAPVPGLGAEFGGLMSFGMSLNPMALRSFYEARLDAMEADPFECELFGELQAGVAKGREALAQPIPPMVYSFRGFLANIMEMRGGDLANDKPPEEIDGSVLFAVENAEALATMAAMMSPEIAAMNLLPDGKARELNLPQLAEKAQKAFAALSDSALAVAVGTGADGNAEAMLQAKANETTPFASFSMDAKRYYDFMGDAFMKAEPEEGEEPMPEAVRAAFRDAIVSSADIYERMTIDVHLTGRGIEIGSRMTLVD